VSEPAALPADADGDLRVLAGRRRLRAGPWPVLAAISGGGVVGSLARFGLQEAVSHRPGGFAWATFVINVSGCLLIGALMVLVSEVWGGRRLLRPFLGVGVLGGFTTFSTYVIDVQQAVAVGAARVALLYLAGTLVGAMLAVWAGAAVTGWAIRPRRAGSATGSSRRAGGHR
jgi:CrcB protein